MAAYRVFVSHVWKSQHDLYWGLMRLLGNAKRFQFVDLSVPKFRPFDGSYSEVRDDIFDALRTADVVLVINTTKLDRSSSVADELREAEAYGIPIVAISPPKRNGKQPPSRLPQILTATAANWTTASIVAAIKRAREDHRTQQRASETARAPIEFCEISYSEIGRQLSIPKLAEVASDDTEEAKLPLPINKIDDFMKNTPSMMPAVRPHIGVGKSNEPTYPAPPPQLPWWRRLFSSRSTRDH